MSDSLSFLFMVSDTIHVPSFQLKKSFSEQRQVALRDQKNMILQKRQHQLVRRREAQKDLLSLLSVEKWDDSLRNYSPSAEKVFSAPVVAVLGLGGMGGGGAGSGANMRLTGGGGGAGGGKRTQRPRSAPPIMRRANIIHASSMSNSKVRDDMKWTQRDDNVRLVPCSSDKFIILLSSPLSSIYTTIIYLTERLRWPLRSHGMEQPHLNQRNCEGLLLN